MNKICISKIEFKNMFSYGNTWQSFEPDGISFITGHNKNTDRRNFTGKSNLLKVFQFALFGKVDGLTKSRIVNWKNRKNAECYIHFTKGSLYYVIYRGIKPDILTVKCNGEELPVPANKKDFQSQIENDILEMDFMSFMNIVYADTNNSESILSMSKPNKRQFLENIFNLSYYTDLKDKANKKLKAIKDKVTAAKLKLEQQYNKTEQLKQDRDKYSKAYDDISDSSGICNDKIKQKSGKEDQYNNNITKREKNRKQKEDVEESKNVIDKLLIKIKYKMKECVKKIDNDITEYIDVDTIKKKISDEQNNIKECEEDHIKVQQDKLDRLNSDNPDIEDTKDKHIQLHTESKTKLSLYKKQLNEAKDKLNNKTDDVTCPTCLQKVDHRHLESMLRENVDHFTDKVNDTTIICDEYNDKLSSIRDVISSIQLHQKNIDNLSAYIDGFNENIDEWNNELSSAETHNKKKNISDKYKKVLSKLKSSYNHFDNKIKQLDKDILLLTKSIEDVTISIESYEGLADDIRQLKIDINKEQEHRKQMKQWVSDVDVKIDSNVKDIELNNKKLNQLNTMMDYVNVVRDLCGDEKAKQYTISNKIPLLNKRVNYYLSASGVNYYVKLDSWLECEIKGPGIRDASYNNLSGAERISLDIALQFAFHDINKLQSPTTMDLLILDEIIGSNSLDEQGIENLIEIIKIKQQEGDYNILLVSHDEKVKQSDDLIDNYYTIENDGKYSFVVRNK